MAATASEVATEVEAASTEAVAERTAPLLIEAAADYWAASTAKA